MVNGEPAAFGTRIQHSMIMIWSHDVGMRREGVVVASVLGARPADAEDEPVVAEAVVIVSVLSMVG